jgi:hypothetical protein
MTVKVYVACTTVSTTRIVCVWSLCMLAITWYCHEVGKAHADPMMQPPHLRILKPVVNATVLVSTLLTKGSILSSCYKICE